MKTQVYWFQYRFNVREKREEIQQFVNNLTEDTQAPPSRENARHLVAAIEEAYPGAVTSTDEISYGGDWS